MEVDDLEVEQPEVETSIEDDIRSAMASLKTDAEAAPSEPVTEKPRDESGKFAAKTSETAPKRETLTLPEKTGEANVASAEIPAPAPPTAQPIKAPPGWNTAMREKFSGLPPEVQSYISQRDSDIEKKITAQDEERMFGKGIKEIVSPYLPTIRAEGGTPEKAIESLLQTAHQLRQGNDYQKAQSVAGVMQAFKVDPNILLSILQGGNVVQGNSPQHGMNNSVIETLQQRIDRLESERQAEVQQRHTQEQHTLQSQIESFAAKPGHEHFEKVRTLMGVFLENGSAKDLDDAYDMAIHANPEIRSSLVSANLQAEQDKRLTEQKARADAARRAGGSVNGGPGSAKSLNGTGANVPLEETIRASIRESQGRV